MAFDVFEVAEEMRRKQGGQPSGDFDVFAVAEELKNKGTPTPIPADAGTLTNMRVGFAVEPKSDIRILAQRFFPNEPIQKSVGRFGIQDGKYIFVDEQGQLRDASEDGGVARFAGEAGPAIGLGIAGSFGGPVAGAVGAGAGELWRRNLSKVIFHEDERSPLTDIGAGVKEGTIDFAAGKLFQAAGRAVKGVKSLKFTDDVQPNAIKAVQDDVLRKFGIQLDAAQISGDEGLKQLRDWAVRQPSKAAKVYRALADLQNEQGETAVRQLIAAIGQDTTEEATARGVMGSAKAAIKAARQVVDDATKPMYDAAVLGADEAGVRVNINPVIQTLDDLVKNSKGPVKAKLSEARKLFKSSQNPEAWDQSMSGLQQTKKALDALIEGTDASKQLGPTIKRELVQLKQLLLKQMEEASPLYTKANKTYADMTRQMVEPLSDGLVGTLAQLENAGLHKAAKTAARLVTDRNLPLSEVVRVKEAILKTEGGSAAWDGITRLWLQGGLERAAQETGSGEVVNFAGKFRKALYGTPQARAVAKTVLGDKAPIFDDLMAAFQMAANAPIRGSNTQADQMITRNSRSAVTSMVRVFRDVGGSVLDQMDDRAALRFAEQVAAAMTDPTKLKQLTLVRKMPPSLDRALLMTGIVTGNRAGSLLDGTPADMEMTQ